jgi:hypothetical protein
MRLALAALFLIGLARPSAADFVTPPSLISMIRTGSDYFAIVTQQPIANPENCPEADGYYIDSSQPGYNTLYAAALAAYVSKTPVTVTIYWFINKAETTGTVPPPGSMANPDPRCDQGRPSLIGITLSR